MTRFAIQRVRATPEALELIERLMELHGPVAFFGTAGSLEGGTVTCLTRAELLPADSDVKLGEIAGAPFYVDVEEYERSGRPAFVLDVAPGTASGCPLAGLEEVHFVITVPASAVAGV